MLAGQLYRARADSIFNTSCRLYRWTYSCTVGAVGPSRQCRRPGLLCFAGSITGLLFSCKSHKISPNNASKLAIFRSKINLKKFLGRGHSTSVCRRDPASFLDHFKHCVAETWTDAAARVGVQIWSANANIPRRKETPAATGCLAAAWLRTAETADGWTAS